MASRRAGRTSKRHYVKAQAITLVRDPSSGVWVAEPGGDLGARADRADLEIGARQLTEGGMVLCKGARVRAPGRVEKLAEAGLFGPPAAARRLLEAAEHLRVLLELARTRPRVTGRYQPAVERGKPELSERQLAARARLSRLGAAIGWTHYAALTDALAFETGLSPVQEARVAQGLQRLADWLQLPMAFDSA